MPIEVLHQIQYLCKKIPKVEWSGALFYTTEGSIEKPGTFKITLKTILPLDMGSAAYTEYNLDGRFMDFIEEDFEERCTWKLGHIHSHNVMDVFFSGTDMAELNDNAPAHNFYLSLIVNNYMDFLAKVAFIGEAKKDIKQVPYTAKTADGHDYIVERQDFVVDNRKLFIYNCEIDTPKNEIIVSEQFSAQVAKIMEPKPVKKIETRHFPAVPSGKGWQRNPSLKDPILKIPNYKPNNLRQYKSQEEREMESWNKSFTKSKKNDEEGLFNDFSVFDLDKEVDDLEERDLQEQAVYNFCKELFNFTGTLLDDMETLEDMIDMVADLNLTPAELAKAIMTEYTLDFKKHFPNADERAFIEVTYEALDVLKDLEELYPEIKLTIKTIEAMIFKFMENESEKRHNPAV
jgi:hypothetical protein